MKAVTNSSVLIALSSIGQLELLNQRFPDGVMLPQAVWEEVVTTGAGRSGSAEVSQASWLTIRYTEQAWVPLVSLLRLELDEGEAEAIVLFLQEPADFILLDEKIARRVARRLNLPILGTVGILIEAKTIGLISNLKQQLDILQTVGKFRLSQLVYQDALKRVGEL